MSKFEELLDLRVHTRFFKSPQALLLRTEHNAVLMNSLWKRCIKLYLLLKELGLKISNSALLMNGKSLNEFDISYKI